MDDVRELLFAVIVAAVVVMGLLALFAGIDLVASQF